MAEHEPRMVVVLPTYNERANVGRLLEQLRQVLPDAQVVVVDDSSPDGTAASKIHWAICRAPGAGVAAASSGRSAAALGRPMAHQATRTTRRP